MAIHNRVPELLKAKIGEDNINLSELSREIGLSYITVSKWVKNQVTRYDEETLDVWCRYFGLPDDDMVIIYRAESKEDK